jgi:predicted amidohydrolase YtcJ
MSRPDACATSGGQFDKEILMRVPPLSTTPLAGVAAACFLLAGCGGSNSPAETADAVFTNAKVVTVDDKSTVAQAFAVKDGKFLAIGSNTEIQRYVGSATQVTDLQGRTVVPGLSDGHFHDAGGGPGIDLSKTRTLAELLGKVTQAAAKAAPGAILVSNGDWHEAQLKEVRTPRAGEIEAAAPGVPVVLVRGGHSVFLNTTALAKWNITPSTPVPAGGAIPKDASGALTGELVDTARSLIQLPPTPAITVADLEAEQRVLNSYGLVNVRIPGTSINAYRMHQQLRESGKSTVRYSLLFRGPTAEQLATAAIKQGDGDEWVKVWGIKMGVDGGFEGGLMTKPYQEPMGQGGTYFGLRVIPQAAFNAQAVAWNRAGWRLATHAVGDAAVDQVLLGYEQAQADKDIRQAGWTIEHAFVSRPDQYPRMKAMNLRLSVQDHLYLAAPVLKNYWGADRAGQVTPVKTYLEQGLLVAGGTDSSVVPLNPFWVMYHFLTRDTISDGVYGANEAVASREQLLRLITINYAKLTDEAEIKGSIEPKKLADFVVLSADLMTIPAVQVQDLKALATFVGGKKVYQDSSAAL